MADLSIREILEQVSRGQIRIPAFQRGFVWEPERVAYLMDSIYKRYPLGHCYFGELAKSSNLIESLGHLSYLNPKLTIQSTTYLTANNE